MTYQNKRERISTFIDVRLIPILKKTDLDYKEVLKVISENVYATESIIEEVIKAKINSGKMKEIHILTIPDEEVSGWLKELEETEKSNKLEEQKIDNIFKEVEVGVKNNSS